MSYFPLVRVLILYIVCSLIVSGACGVFLYLTIESVKDGSWPKWTYIIWVLSLILTIFVWKGPVDICLDMSYNDIVLYQGTYEERSAGYHAFITVVIFDENGKEIKLQRQGPIFEDGMYTGELYYYKRSKIVVEYKGAPIE